MTAVFDFSVSSVMSMVFGYGYGYGFGFGLFSLMIYMSSDDDDSYYCRLEMTTTNLINLTTLPFAICIVPFILSPTSISILCQAL